MAILLGERLTNMKISGAASRSMLLDEFNTAIQKFDIVSDDKMPKSHKTVLLMKAANADTNLMTAWTVVKTIIVKTKLGTTTTYSECLVCLVSHSEK